MTARDYALALYRAATLASLSRRSPLQQATLDKLRADMRAYETEHKMNAVEILTKLTGNTH